jgi:hypothetical protein
MKKSECKPGTRVKIRRYNPVTKQTLEQIGVIGYQESSFLPFMKKTVFVKWDNFWDSHEYPQSLTKA